MKSLSTQKRRIWEKNLSKLTKEELLVEKKKLKKSKIIHAILIGFLAGIVIFGIVAWSLSSKKNLGFLIPMLIPISVIYKLVKIQKRTKIWKMS